MVSRSQARPMSVGSGFDSQVEQQVLLSFFLKNFSVVARSLEVDGVTSPCLEKHVKPLVPAIFRRSLTVVTDSQKPESLTSSLTKRLSCCPVTGLWRSDRQSLHVKHWYSAASG